VVSTGNAAKANSLGAGSRSDRLPGTPGVMSTNTDLDPTQIIAFFVRRSQIEVTFGETRAHLGVEPNASGMITPSCERRLHSWLSMVS